MNISLKKINNLWILICLDVYGMVSVIKPNDACWPEYFQDYYDDFERRCLSLDEEKKNLLAFMADARICSMENK